ncbi:MAG: AAA family ATPase [Candidatus Aminicenantes bacterium]|nr:AAA family ATPase [Candidatus Aminicenantes bacterium]
MRITQLEISGFRGIKHGVLSLPRHCVLLGPNDVGKTSIAEALALLAGRDRLTRPTCDWDFYGGAPDASSRFDIIATVTDFGDGKSQQPKDHPDWFAGERSATPVWWHEETSTLSTEADPPAGACLAAQIAVSGRYDDESSDFEAVRYFWDGQTDPFTEDHRTIPGDRLRDLGIFLLPGSRDSERMLGFGSSSFIKLLREYQVMPVKAVEDLKQELRNPASRIEEASGLKELLEEAEAELRSFLFMRESSRLAYRATSLDVLSVLRSLVAHVQDEGGVLLPVARHGSGMVSLQVFVVLLAFAQYRRDAGRDFFFVAEEPELHLHPSLHRRLISRVRATSTQSLVTTHSPTIASHYGPTEAIYLRNAGGELTGEPLQRNPVTAKSSKAVRKLYLSHRHQFYDALMGGAVVVPEGVTDQSWLALWQRVAEAAPEVAKSLKLRPLTFITTHDGAVADTYAEVRRFRPDALPLVDGDTAGTDYIDRLAALSTPPERVAQYGPGAAVECLAAWILEPCPSSTGTAIAELLAGATHTLRQLQLTLCAQKGDDTLREALAWEALETEAAVRRAGEFLQDLTLIAQGKPPANPGWTHSTRGGVSIHTATHVRKATP